MDAVWVCEEDLNRLGKDGDQIHNVTLFARDKGCPAGGDQSALVQLCRAPQPSAALPGKGVGTGPDAEFEVWRDSLPDTHWAKYDLSACRLGWDAAVALTADELTERRAADFENGRWIARAMSADAALVSQPQPEGEAVDCCPICLVPFKPGDLCSTDIELGTCHAGCLEGSPTVNLETGEPTDGPIPTFHYAELVHPDPTLQGAGLIEAVKPDESSAFARGMAVAAGILMSCWGDEVQAREILGAAGLTTVKAMRASGVDTYDIRLCLPVLRQFRDKARRAALSPQRGAGK